MDICQLGRNLLPLGTPLAGGVIVATSLTAYRVELISGSTVWVPFTRVHPPVAATPLVQFGGQS